MSFDKQRDRCGAGRNSAKAQSIFDTDTSGTITRAEASWSSVKDKPL